MTDTPPNTSPAPTCAFVDDEGRKCADVYASAVSLRAVHGPDSNGRWCETIGCHAFVTPPAEQSPTKEEGRTALDDLLGALAESANCATCKDVGRHWQGPGVCESHAARMVARRSEAMRELRVATGRETRPTPQPSAEQDEYVTASQARRLLHGSRATREHYAAEQSVEPIGWCANCGEKRKHPWSASGPSCERFGCDKFRPEESERSEFTWLIERTDNGAYWDGRASRYHGHRATYILDPNDAVRFSRKEDAERVIAWLLEGEPVVAREHGWVSHPAPVVEESAEPSVKPWVVECQTCGRQLLTTDGAIGKHLRPYASEECLGGRYGARFAADAPQPIGSGKGVPQPPSDDEVEKYVRGRQDEWSNGRAVSFADTPNDERTVAALLRQIDRLRDQGSTNPESDEQRRDEMKGEGR